MLRPETCVDCGKQSPTTNTEQTLTTSFGWRAVRAVNERGETTLEWRCMACWRAYKERDEGGSPKK